MCWIMKKTTSQRMMKLKFHNLGDKRAKIKPSVPDTAIDMDPEMTHNEQPNLYGKPRQINGKPYNRFAF